MKAYILTTENNHNRAADLSNYPKALPEPELFYGVEPENSDIPAWWLKEYKNAFKEDKPERVYCCSKSKELLFRKHKELYPNEDLLLLEDDVVFTEDANEKYDKFIADIPEDWKLLYLGGYHEYNCRGCTPLEVKPGILRVFMDVGNEALIINSNVLDEAIELVTNSPDNHFGHSDWRLIQLQKKYCCYAPLGFIAGQQDGWSNLFQKERAVGFRNDFFYEGYDRQVHQYGNPKRFCECCKHKCGNK